MSYEKQTWQTGDIITAVKLNHMEDGIAEGAGYTVETQAVAVVPEQTVTTVMPEGRPFAFGQINIAEGITNDIPDTLTITFNGQEYVCSSISSDSTMKNYGAPMVDGVPDWSQYPFIVSFEPETENVLVTESAGTYTIKAEEVSETITVTDDFTKAVNKVTSTGIPAYTLDNVGAVLTVKADIKDNATIIPEQSVTILAGTSTTNLSDCIYHSSISTVFINGEEAKFANNAYKSSAGIFKIDLSVSPAEITNGVFTTSSKVKVFEPSNVEQDTTITIKGLGTATIPYLAWVNPSTSGN